MNHLDNFTPNESTRSFSDRNLLQIGLPMGGIGAGCICLSGTGSLEDFSIRNRPATTGVADGHGTNDAAFALLHIKGKDPVTRLVEGPMPPEKIYNLGLGAQGYRKGGYEGLPRFAHCEFTGEYPFGEARLSDPDLPLAVSVLGWNPFIPLDDINSGIPCAILNYTVKNKSDKPVDFELSYHLSHLAPGSHGEQARYESIPGSGIHFTNKEAPGHNKFGSAALAVVGHTPKIKTMWPCNGWPFDVMSTLWKEVSTGSFTENEGIGDVGIAFWHGGSILLAGSLAPGESVTYPIVISWYFPNSDDSHGAIEAAPACGTDCGCGDTGPAPKWRPYYVSQWKDAREAALYVRDNYDSLFSRTLAFKDALFGSTLPPYVLDAISANLAILKSPTVLRQENGNVWAWEGCFVASGCCHGSCTHVWNYAQALPHLFPALERTLREQEYLRSMAPDTGHVNFRAALPDGPNSHDWHAASDGQLGGILKLYRDWQISGDTPWLARLYPLAKLSLDYCIRTWDPDRKGALIEPHHNTYDIEFWGPDSLCTSIYIGALSAMAAICRALDKPAEADHYATLAAKGAEFLAVELFNGEFYIQKTQWEGLRDKSFAKQVDDLEAKHPLLIAGMREEGPWHQYGPGVLADGVLGAWMATIYGVDTPLDNSNVVSHLNAIFKHNFKADLSKHACTQRPGYAMGHEPGLILCSWPRGGRPTVPFPYSDEVWTGFEYQVASHLIEEGLVEEGLRIVEAARSRYNGHVRNPWNEYECGSYYARAMSSYALLGSLSGFRYSAVEKTLWFGPKLNSSPFQTFFSTASGFGTIRLDGKSLTVEMVEGELAIERLCLNGKNYEWKAVVKRGEPMTITLS